MNSVKKIFKIILFGAILLILSAAYRIFGEKKDVKEGDLFKVNSAKADIPTTCGGSCGTSEAGTSTTCG